MGLVELTVGENEENRESVGATAVGSMMGLDIAVCSAPLLARGPQSPIP